MPNKTWAFLKKKKQFTCVDHAYDYIAFLYKRSIAKLQKRLDSVIEGREVIRSDWPCYPFLGISINHHQLRNARVQSSYGVIHEAGNYGTTFTQPDVLKIYIKSQLRSLQENHPDISFVVGESQDQIPMPFALDGFTTHEPSLRVEDFKNLFVMPDLKRIDDQIVNKWGHYKSDDIRPLSLFCAERIDYSLERIKHYCASKPHNFQNFIILTNYQRYVNDFLTLGRELINAGKYENLLGPNNQNLNDPSVERDEKLPQMPAYHLTRGDKNGITLINIGVGPSNARNMTDHLAVLRPHCWIMLGHCAGLRASQKLGDYVLGHAYVRDDHVLDHELPTWVAIPAIAEIQIAFEQAIDQNSLQDFPKKVRTGTVFTTDNRNWELDAESMYPKFMLSRAIAVDMESATIAANGYRFRVPYGTLLCVSDKPIHGVLKMRGMANSFYENQVAQHLKAGMDTIALLQNKGEKLHSRKLRGFDECPFR